MFQIIIRKTAGRDETAYCVVDEAYIQGGDSSSECSGYTDYTRGREIQECLNGDSRVSSECSGYTDYTMGREIQVQSAVVTVVTDRSVLFIPRKVLDQNQNTTFIIQSINC